MAAGSEDPAARPKGGARVAMRPAVAAQASSWSGPSLKHSHRLSDQQQQDGEDQSSSVSVTLLTQITLIPEVKLHPQTEINTPLLHKCGVLELVLRSVKG